LTQVPGVSAVSIEVQGLGKIPVSSLPPAVSSLSDLGFSVAPAVPATVGLLRSKEGLERTNPQLLGEGGSAPAVKGTKSVADLPKIPDTYVNLATSGDGSEIAGVSSSRAELARWRGGAESTVLPFGTALTNPMYASDGRLWIAGLASGKPRIWTFDAATFSGGPREVTAGWLGGRQVVNLSVSPDATRIAVLSKLPGDTDYRLDVAGIVRDASGMATALAEPYRQGEPLVRFVDVTWLDQVTMAVLAREKEGAPLRPFRVDLGQGVGLRRVGQLELDQTLMRELPDATSLTSRGGLRGLVVMTAQAAFLRAGNAWAQQVDTSEIIIAGT
jgi:Lipoprotein LpqB beta-propeller domain